MHTYNLRPRPIKREIIIIKKISKPKRVKKVKNVFNNQLIIYNQYSYNAAPQIGNLNPLPTITAPRSEIDSSPPQIDCCPKQQQPNIDSYMTQDPETCHLLSQVAEQPLKEEENHIVSMKEPEESEELEEMENVNMWNRFEPTKNVYAMMVIVAFIQIGLMAFVVYKVEMPTIEMPTIYVKSLVSKIDIHSVKEFVSKKELVEPTIHLLKNNFGMLREKANRFYHKSMAWN
jgi:hypothetical protein